MKIEDITMEDEEEDIIIIFEEIITVMKDMYKIILEEEDVEEDSIIDNTTMDGTDSNLTNTITIIDKLIIIMMIEMIEIIEITLLLNMSNVKKDLIVKIMKMINNQMKEDLIKDHIPLITIIKKQSRNIIFFIEKND
jgi:hypothetical protein